MSLPRFLLKSDINFVVARAPYQELGSIATLKSGPAHCSLEICDPVRNMVPLILAIGSYWHWAACVPLSSPGNSEVVFEGLEAFHLESNIWICVEILTYNSK